RLARWSSEIRESIPDAAGLSVGEILGWPGIFGTEAFSQETLLEEMGKLAKIALEDFSSTRRREGEKLKAILIERMAGIRGLAGAVSPKVPELIASFQEKLVLRLREAMVDLNDERIRHELTLFASKIDVDEELSRLNAHLDEMERILGKGGVVGKRLDFLMQELNREANTLGSKSSDIEVSRIAMEIKVLIEQMREQIQNIE
ncbi:MAG TPA: YicC family protein, partial [Burkholderiales bacterium]|nr:YicC family protein [Burkholderiales bacterium]